MAKHKQTQLKQTELPKHEYISKLGDMVEHAYGIKPTDSNPHVKNKLITYQIENLKEIFSHALEEDQKQKIRALGFGEKSNFDSISNCDINAIKSNNCFKCGSDSHYIKDWPLSKDDNGTQSKRQYSYQNKTSNNSSTDNATESLTKLFNNLVEQLQQLNPSGNNTNNTPSYNKGNDIDMIWTKTVFSFQ